MSTLLRRWAFNVLIGIDQLANAITGGDPDETISSRAGKARRQGRWWGCVLCRLLDRIDPRHCAESIEEDEGGRAL